MTLLGVVGCMVLLVGALGMKDTVDAFVDVFYNQAINYETKVNIDSETATNKDAIMLAEKYNGDWCSQSSVQIADKPVILEIYHIENDKVRFVKNDISFVTLEDYGAYISARIADSFNLSAGDSFTFSLYDSNKEYTVKVSGILRSVSESIIMTDKYADSIGLDYKINVIYTDDQSIIVDTYIANTQSKQSIIDSFDMVMELMSTMVMLLCLAAIVLGIVVLYNLGVMSYTERYREMAILKVLGFKDGKIGALLIGQNLWITVIGVAIGLPCGIVVLQYLLSSLASEYEMKLVIGPLTICVSILLTFGVSFIVGLMISQKNKKIDMVEALKGAE